MLPYSPSLTTVWLLIACSLLLLQPSLGYTSQYFKQPLWLLNIDCSDSDVTHLAQGYDQAVQAIRAGLDAVNTVASPAGQDTKTYRSILRMIFAMYGIEIDPQQGGNGLPNGSADRQNFNKIQSKVFALVLISALPSFVESYGALESGFSISSLDKY